MKKTNPLYFRFNKGWPLRNFLKFGVIIGIVFGIVMPFTIFFIKIKPFTIPFFFFHNTIPFKIIFQIGHRGDIPFVGFLSFPICPFLLPDFISFSLFIIIVYFSYYALLGAFAGFISNVMLCIYKKVKINIDEEDIDSVDYLDFSKKITWDEILIFLALGVILTIIAVAVPSYFLWDWNINVMIW
jgi:hypothetical protein